MKRASPKKQAGVNYAEDFRSEVDLKRIAQNTYFAVRSVHKFLLTSWCVSFWRNVVHCVPSAEGGWLNSRHTGLP